MSLLKLSFAAALVVLAAASAHADDEKPKRTFREALENALRGATLSRPPQEVPKDAKKLEPRFRSSTKEIKAPDGKYTFKIPEKWTLTGGQDANVRYAVVNPGYGPADVVKHQIVYWQTPVLPADANKGFKDRVEEGARKLELTYPAFKRTKTQVLDAPSGLIGRVDFAGTIANQLGEQKVVALVAVRQIKNYYLAVSVVSLEDAKGEMDDDALAVLDAAVIVIKDRDPEAEKQLVGEWVIPNKKGDTLETYTFNADGTYRWHFEGSWLVKVPDGAGGARAGAAGASAGDESGRYEVRGDTLYFVSDRGEQGSFFKLSSEGGKRHLQIGSADFVR